MEDELLNRIKVLTVQGLNLLINWVKFLRLSQEQGENTMVFVARFKGQANWSSFKVRCSCDKLMYVLYVDPVIAHQLVRSLGDVMI